MALKVVIFLLMLSPIISSYSQGNNFKVFFNIGGGKEYFISSKHKKFLDEDYLIKLKYNYTMFFGFDVEYKKMSFGGEYNLTQSKLKSNNIDVQYSKDEMIFDYSYFFNVSKQIRLDLGVFASFNNLHANIENIGGSLVSVKYINQNNELYLNGNSNQFERNFDIGNLACVSFLAKNENSIINGISCIGKYYILNPKYSIEKNAPFRLFRNSFSLILYLRLSIASLQKHLGLD